MLSKFCRGSSVAGLGLLSRMAFSSTAKPAFDKILVANRGEIACRVISSAKKLGIKSVAIYSEPDARSLHVKMADEAVCVGPAPSAQSYLVIDNIVQACLKTGAQAVHPGYGFLSEQAAFCDELESNGIAFIGPKKYAITSMGDKIASKKIARDAGVNTIPGWLGEIRDEDHVVEIAREIGYPVMIKASAGGGGKGMRVAWDDEDARTGFRFSRREAKSAFGDERIFVEKFIEEPRHIEIQVLADAHGNAVYLNERECSIQRRNQKVIEEAPSVFLDEETRRSMGEQAVAMSKAVDYQSAGTVEFLVDKHQNFYFLEMNTRLQVEHPVTELTTGVDLVEQMFNIAAGRKLEIQQKDVSIKGWAIESRVYAEDPLTDFLPSIGFLDRYEEPTGEGVRCDSGVLEGSEVSMHYDPLLCKLVTYGKDRTEAIDRMRTALDSYVVQGVTNNICFLQTVMGHERFVSGNISTKFIEEEYADGYQGHTLSDVDRENLVGAAVTLYAAARAKQTSISGTMGSFDAQADLQRRLAKVCVLIGAEPHEVCVGEFNDAGMPASLKMRAVPKEGEPGEWRDIALEATVPTEGGVLFTVNAGHDEMTLQLTKGSDQAPVYTVRYLGTEFPLAVLTPREVELDEHTPEPEVVDTSRVVQSPMAGLVVSISVKAGDEVVPGQEVAVVEAMKMQNALRAVKAGVVKEVHAAEGDNVAAGDFVLELE